MLFHFKINFLKTKKKKKRGISQTDNWSFHLMILERKRKLSPKQQKEGNNKVKGRNQQNWKQENNRENQWDKNQ